MASSSREFITPPTNQRHTGEEISLEKIKILNERIKVLEMYFEGHEIKREKKKKADSLAHFFNDDKEASFLVSSSQMWTVSIVNFHFIGYEVLRTFNFGRNLFEAVFSE
jgi:hypothetical protein